MRFGQGCFCSSDLSDCERRTCLCTQFTVTIFKQPLRGPESPGKPLTLPSTNRERVLEDYVPLNGTRWWVLYGNVSMRWAVPSQGRWQDMFFGWKVDFTKLSVYGNPLDKDGWLSFASGHGPLSAWLNHEAGSWPTLAIGVLFRLVW